MFHQLIFMQLNKFIISLTRITRLWVYYSIVLPINLLFFQFNTANRLMMRFCSFHQPISPKIYFILGGPGAGKGTLCQKLSQARQQFRHISAGDLLRRAINSNAPERQIIEEHINSGRIVPVYQSFVTIGLLEQELRADGRHSEFLIDGFPRNYENMVRWQELMDRKTRFQKVIHVECTEVSFLHISQDEMKRRIIQRSETSGRSDDNLEVLRKRFKTYLTDTQPIIDHYRGKTQLITINGNLSREAVLAELIQKLQ